MARRALRAVGALAVIGGGLFALSGQWRDPWLWAYLATWTGLVLYAMSILDDDLARERFRPPTAGADRLWLRAIRLTAVAHLIVGALDTGRWHLGSVPPWLRGAALAAMAASGLLVFRAMATNRFFSAVVRIQSDRGHHVIDRGPYALVRHPGYAGMMLAIPFSALVLGSWVSFAVALVYSALILRRVRFEDDYLHRCLDGYANYALRVRHKVLPGLW